MQLGAFSKAFCWYPNDTVSFTEGSTPTVKTVSSATSPPSGASLECHYLLHMSSCSRMKQSADSPQRSVPPCIVIVFPKINSVQHRFHWSLNPNPNLKHIESNQAEPGKIPTHQISTKYPLCVSH